MATSSATERDVAAAGLEIRSLGQVCFDKFEGISFELPGAASGKNHCPQKPCASLLTESLGKVINCPYLNLYAKIFQPETGKQKTETRCS
ncbi:MAG TPA: hypothetical protein DCY27_12105 [Desulfobacterales bacterium]|nr:hypothetical protein [Desulfobacterales bacterium]